MRTAGVQAISGPMVQRIHRTIDLDLSDTGQTHCLGGVRSQPPVVVSIESTLPSAVRLGKVLVGIQTFLRELVICKLFAVVKGDRLTTSRAGTQQIDDSLVHLCASASG